MQKVLDFVLEDKKYISKPFDFEAMCIINDAHNDSSKKGPLNICRDALDYMFEGTEATDDVINSMDIGERSKLCLKLWDFYVGALSSKKE